MVQNATVHHITVSQYDLVYLFLVYGIFHFQLVTLEFLVISLECKFRQGSSFTSHSKKVEGNKRQRNNQSKWNKKRMPDIQRVSCEIKTKTSCLSRHRQSPVHNL